MPNLQAEHTSCTGTFSVRVGEQPNTFLSAADMLSESGSGKLFEMVQRLSDAPTNTVPHLFT